LILLNSESVKRLFLFRISTGIKVLPISCKRLEKSFTMFLKASILVLDNSEKFKELVDLISKAIPIALFSSIAV